MATEKKAAKATPKKAAAKDDAVKPVTHAHKNSTKKEAAAHADAHSKADTHKKTTPKAVTPKVELVKEVKVKVPKTSVKTSVPYQPDYQPLEERSEDENAHSQPLVRYSDSDLKEFRDLINKKLVDAKRELSYLQGLITRKDHLGGEAESRYMTMEDGTVSMEREQLSQMASRQISYIDHLEKALIRIENKTYGICRVTGKLIEKARLKAVPHATLSLEAKMNMAKQHHAK